MATRILEAILKLTLDRTSADKAKQPITDLEKHLQKLEREGGSVRVELARTFNAIRTGALKADEAVEQLDKSMKALEDHGDKIRNFTGYLGEIGASVAGAGALIAGPLVFATYQYVNAIGEADDTSRDWLSSMEDIERSQLRIGKVAAQQLLPFLEKAAGLAEKAAAFAEEHPGVVQAALGIGGALLAVGSLAALTAKTITLVTAAQGMVAQATQLLASRLLTASAAGGATGVAGTVAVGAAAAAGSYGINEAYKGIAGQIFSGLEGVLGKSEEDLGGVYQGIKKINTEYGVGIYQAMAYWDMLTGKFDETEAQASKAAQAIEETNQGLATLANSPHGQQILDAYIGLREQQLEADRKYKEASSNLITEGNNEKIRLTQAQEERRAEMIAEFEKSQAEEIANYNRQRDKDLRDFNRDQQQEERDHLRTMAGLQESARKDAEQAESKHKSEVAGFLKQEGRQEQQAEADYYKRRRKVAEAANEEERDAEAEHQKQMRRMQEDHLLNLEDAVRAQDAIGFLREQREYERSRKRAEEDYQDQAKERNSETAKNLAEMEADFQAQREQRQKEREERVAQMEAEFQAEQAERTKQDQERIAQEQTQYEEEKARRQEAFDLKRQDEEEDFKREQDQAQAQFDQQFAKQEEQDQKELIALDEKNRQALANLTAHYQEEKAARQRAFTEQVRALDAALLGEKETRNKYYKQMATDLDRWLKQMQQKTASMNAGAGTNGTDPSPIPAMQSGGYSRGGLARLHNREFVLNPSTTAGLENALGGSLTQAGLLSLGGGMGGGGDRYASQHNEFNFSERDDARRIAAMVEQITSRMFLDYERG